MIHSLHLIILVSILEFQNWHEHNIAIIIFKISILHANNHLTSWKITMGKLIKFLISHSSDFCKIQSIWGNHVKILKTQVCSLRLWHLVNESLIRMPLQLSLSKWAVYMRTVIWHQGSLHNRKVDQIPDIP